MYFRKVKADYLITTLYCTVGLVGFIFFIAPVIALLDGVPLNNLFAVISEAAPITIFLALVVQLLGLPYALLKYSSIHIFISAIIFGLLTPIFVIFSLHLTSIQELPVFLTTSDAYKVSALLIIVGIAAFLILIKQSPNKAVNNRQ